MNEMEAWAIYLRKSREDLDREARGEKETLRRHRDILTDHAARRGLFIAKTYEEVVSGETIEARPQIQQLIKDCYEGKYKGILVVEVTRLSRGNQGDAQTILDCLKYSNKNNGVLVVTPTKTYDVAHSPEDEEYMEFELFMSRREYKMIQKRLERGRRQAVVEGNYMGAYRPYGYDIQKTRTGRTLIPNPEEAQIVKDIFGWVVRDNMTAGAIARRLTAMGVPTYTGAPEWVRSTVKDILTNPTYVGKVRWNDRMEVKTMKDGKIVRSRPRSNHTASYMEYQGKHEALVDEETFKAAGESYYSDKTKAGLKLKNPLAGILVCKQCGKAMIHQRYKAYRNTPDRFNHPPSELCKVKSAIDTDVMNAVCQSLRMYIEDFRVKVDNLPAVDENAIQAQIDALQREIKKTEKKLDRIFDDYEEGVYTANEFVSRKAKHTDRIEAIKVQIEELEASVPDREEYSEKIMLLSDALNAIMDKDLEASVKNNYLKAIVSKIEFSRENNDEFILDVILR